MPRAKLPPDIIQPRQTCFARVSVPRDLQAIVDLAVSLDLGFDPADHRQVWEHRFAWVMPVRGHPVDLVADRMPAGFDPSSGEVCRLMGFEHHIIGRIVEQRLDIGIHGGPVLLQ